VRSSIALALPDGFAIVIYKSNCDSFDEKSMRCKHAFTKMMRLVPKVDATGFEIPKVDATGSDPESPPIKSETH
jgi:hypothetical protein